MDEEHTRFIPETATQIGNASSMSVISADGVEQADEEELDVRGAFVREVGTERVQDGQILFRFKVQALADQSLDDSQDQGSSFLKVSITVMSVLRDVTDCRHSLPPHKVLVHCLHFWLVCRWIDGIRQLDSELVHEEKMHQTLSQFEPMHHLS